MKVLSAHKGHDTAGIGWLLAAAFRRLPSYVQLRSAVRRRNYIQYPSDMPWGSVQDEWAAAEVVHLHNSFGTWSLLGGGKPFVMHHHGTYYRTHAELLNGLVAEHGGRAVVSTLDLLDYGDNLTWCPAPYDLDWLAKFRRPVGGKLRIGHAPTERTIKSTEAFLKACAKLDVEPVLIEGRTWADCLRIKGTCDVLFDQVRLGYGHNAIEAWGMGIPVIAGAAESTLTRMADTFGSVPFLAATERTIRRAIETMTDDDTRAEWASVGLEHVHRWHDGRETVDVLTRTYAEVLAASSALTLEG